MNLKENRENIYSSDSDTVQLTGILNNEEKVETIIKSWYENSNEQLIIAIHTPKTSKKHRLSLFIQSILQKYKISNFLLNLENFYKSFELKRDEREYNYFNPGAYDWDKINKSMKYLTNDVNHDSSRCSIDSTEIEYCGSGKEIPTYKFSFITKESQGPYWIVNDNFKVIIVEGMYALNLFSEKSFDHENFDPWKLSYPVKTIKTSNFSNLNVLKIKVSDTNGLKINYCDNIQKSKEQLSYIYTHHINLVDEKFIKLANKWMNLKEFKEDINVMYGMCNEKEIKILCKILLNIIIGTDCTEMINKIYDQFMKNEKRCVL
ncbi:hypothetical protein SLOPH_2707 [Spraguea lophii 42_110]|uniref:Uncharacterized protein n=1 Tax=Spraguea lophii (strain 42_110) TaxID=1358809 RepID=S7WAU4_SPRLO|nr:hypothetical protein SLOPH_2707 [Spraguea lophii 42_110]